MKLTNFSLEREAWLIDLSYFQAYLHYKQSAIFK